MTLLAERIHMIVLDIKENNKCWQNSVWEDGLSVCEVGEETYQEHSTITGWKMVMREPQWILNAVSIPKIPIIK